MTFDKYNIDQVRKDLQDSLQSFEHKYNVKVKIGQITYYPDRITCPLSAETVLEGYDAEQSAFIKAAKTHGQEYGFTWTDYKRRFETMDDEFELIGFSERSRKYKFLGRSLSNGKTYKFRASIVEKLKH